MAQRTPGDEPSETERLLAEVEGMLGDQPRRSLQPHGDAQPQRRPFRRRVRAAALAGAVGGVGVWFLFAILPFLHAASGGFGAVLATFAAVLVFRREDCAGPQRLAARNKAVTRPDRWIHAGNLRRVGR